MNIFNKKIVYILLASVGIFSLPQIVFAQTIQNVLIVFLQILDRTIPVIMGLALVYLLWGLSLYILKTDDVEGKKGAKNMMFWGVIILFVMISIWGLVNVLGSIFVLNRAIPANVPQLFVAPVDPPPVAPVVPIGP